MGAITFLVKDKCLLCYQLLTLLYILQPKRNTDNKDTNHYEHIVILGREYSCNLKVGTLSAGFCTKMFQRCGTSQSQLTVQNVGHISTTESGLFITQRNVPPRMYKA